MGHYGQRPSTATRPHSKNVRSTSGAYAAGMPITRVRPPKPRERDLSRWPGVGVLVLVSAVFLGLQVSMTDYGENGVGAAVFWFVIGCWLLWLVHARRSRVARLLVGA